MNAFDMISEPVLFVQELREYSGRVHQGVELIQSLAEALLAEDHEKIRTLHEQMSGIRDEVDQSRRSLHSQIKEMHFHSARGDAFSQYVACQDKVASSSQAFAELLVLRKTAVPIELRDDFRALVAEVINVSRRTMSLAEGLSCEAQTVCTDTQAQNSLDAIRGITDDKGQARQREVEFARHLYSLEKQLDPVTIMFLDKYRATLHEVADNAEHAADHLRLMIR
jgi:predicted phosphate transport protein (TIGR00153 family)